MILGEIEDQPKMGESLYPSQGLRIPVSLFEYYLPDTIHKITLTRYPELLIEIRPDVGDRFDLYDIISRSSS